MQGETSSSSNVVNSRPSVINKRSVPPYFDPKRSARNRANQHALKPTANVPYKITVAEFFDETTESDRNTLILEFCLGVNHFIDQDRAIYLEGLGILFPTISSRNQYRTTGHKVVINTEKLRVIEFEKSYELVPAHLQKYGDIVETGELARRIHPRLPLSLQKKWSERATARYLRGLVLHVKNETVVRGYSGHLYALGDFYSLHNRQGNHYTDWYAGADIFFRARHEQILEVSSGRVHERPVLKDAWEPLEVAYGAPLKVLSINLSEKLAELGYEKASPLTPNGEALTIPVAIFKGSKNSPHLIYCTEGFRVLTSSNGQKKSKPGTIGNEFVFQLNFEDLNNPIPSPSINPEDIPEWPLTALTAAWLLLTNTRSRIARIGRRTFGEATQEADGGTELAAILASAFSRARAEQLTEEAAFSYVNIVGIHEDEVRVAERYSVEYLVRLLEHRGVDQVTRLSRPSIATKTAFLLDEVGPQASLSMNWNEERSR